MRQAWHQVRVVETQEKLLSEARGLLAKHRLAYVRLTPWLRVAWMTPEAERCLKAFFPRTRSAHSVPDAIIAWLRTHPIFPGAEDLPSPHSALPLVRRTATHQLNIRVSRTEDGGFLLALRSEPIVLSAEGFTYPGLTRSENQVLFWITQGRSNADVATLLGISGRTVNKHIQNLFAKMGVVSRSEAIVAAHQALPEEHRDRDPKSSAS